MRRKISRLVLVYDAESGLFSALVDSLKKLFGRGCVLCSVTHGLAGKRPAWAAAEQELGVPFSYLHADELGDVLRRHPNLELPCILAELDGAQEELVLLDAGTIRRARGTPGDLKGRVQFRAACLELELPVTTTIGLDES